MSHFTLLVRISAERRQQHGSLDRALEAMMEPYSENAKDEKYLTFDDVEDDSRKKYETESIDMWERHGMNERYYTWDERFRLKSQVDSYGQLPDKPPPGYTMVSVPYSTLFATFEKYMSEFSGHKTRDPKTNRYGYWRNEKGYWDWYSIGGRWSGFFQLKKGMEPIVGEPGVFKNEPKPGHGDVVKVSDLDLPALRRQQTKQAREFWKKWLAWLKSPEDDSWTAGVRPRALDCGLLRVVEGPYEPGENEIVIPWTKYREQAPRPREASPRDLWNDVAIGMPEKLFFEEYEACFHPLLTYAALDENGWYQPGKMGWFGVSHTEPDNKVAFQRRFVGQFIEEAKPTDLLVLLDCHT